MMLLLLLLFCIVTLILWIVLRYRRINDFVKDVPFISVDTFTFFNIGKSDMNEKVTQISNSYERLGKGWIGPILTIFMDHPDDLRVILNSEDCLDKPYIYRFLQAGNGLLTANEQIWKYHRKHYRDGFKMNTLRAFVPIFNEEVSKLVQKLNKKVDAPAFDISEYLYGSNAQTIFRTAMDIKSNILDTDHHVARMIKFIQRLLEISTQRFENFILHPEFIFKLTNKYREQQNLIKECTQLIAQVKDECTAVEEVERTDDVKDNFILKTIIQMQRDGLIDQKTFQDHINTILVAGSDTTTLSISAALMMLAIHSDVQEKAYNEIINVCGTDARYYDLNTISNLKYVECILNETMRLYPVVAILGRTTASDVKLETHTIPKDTIVIMFINKTQRNPKFWGQNANQFDPDRFSSENIHKLKSYTFLPFSSGSRNCIGHKYAMISMKIQLCFLLTNFKFETDVRMDDIRMKLNVMNRFANGYPLRILRRKPDLSKQ